MATLDSSAVAPRRTLGERAAIARQALAALLLAAGCVTSTYRVVAAMRDGASFVDAFDPAPLFYVAGAVGLALGLFWARYLAICFAIAIGAVNFFWSPKGYLVAPAGTLFVALLAGERMRARFEGKGGRGNRWSAALDARVGRLRSLFVAQALAIGMIFAARGHLPEAASLVVVGVAGVALAGLVFHRTWAALLCAPAVAAEAWLAVASAHAELHLEKPPAWTFPAALGAACLASACVIAPLWIAIAAKVARHEPDAR
ncbi:MAG TPA: hypothetical protein VGM56_09975 [Byssovorax sp.]|jgi:hypothetical protein